MFCFEHEEIDPDIVTMSKGITGGYMPLSAISVKKQLADVFESSSIPLPYGHTTSGHSAACASALATIEIIQTEDLIKNSLHRGVQLLDLIKNLYSCKEVVDIRGIGLVVVVEFENEHKASKVLNQALLNGLLIRQQRQALMLIPPLMPHLKQLTKLLKYFSNRLVNKIR